MMRFVPFFIRKKRSAWAGVQTPASIHPAALARYRWNPAKNYVASVTRIHQVVVLIRFVPNPGS
jgi:hypothetical protein